MWVGVSSIHVVPKLAHSVSLKTGNWEGVALQARRALNYARTSFKLYAASIDGWVHSLLPAASTRKLQCPFSVEGADELVHEY